MSLWTSPKFVIGTVGSAIFVAMALGAPVLAPYDPLAIDLSQSNAPPSYAHPLGADYFGRDLVSRIIWGARPALFIAFGSTLLGAAAGTAVGLAAGYLRGLVEMILMRLIDLLLSFPVLILALALVALVGPSMINLTVTIGILFVPRFARIMRGEAISLRERDFVLAAKAAGCNSFAIIMRHILPNALPQLIITATVFFANAILVEASLSFLGAGILPPIPSWGNILAEGRAAILIAPWIVVFPGLFLTATLVFLNLLGDVARDRLDPRLEAFRS